MSPDEVISTLTPEQVRAVAEAGGRPLRLEDPGTREMYVLVKSEVFDRLQVLAADGLDPTESYPAIDEAFREGWDAPGMSDYDDVGTGRL